MSPVVLKSRGLEVISDEARVEASLWRRHAQNPLGDARDKLFDLHREFALKLSRREFAKRPSYGLDRTDFDQLAFMGLLQAIDRYDPTAGCRFTTFARFRICGSIADGVVKSSERANAYWVNQRSERDRLQSLHRSPPQNSSSKEDMSSMDELRDFVVNLAVGVLIESVTEEMVETLSDETMVNGYESLHFNQTRAIIRRTLKSIPRAEKTVVDYHYFKDMSFTLIAELMRVTKGRISQLHKSAIKRLRLRLRV